MKDIYILAIESSCDETSVSIIKNGKEDIATIINSQIDVHTKYGGVVPEVASRLHLENITMVIDECLNKANMKVSDMDAIACTYAPGLLGSLLVGVEAAKVLAYVYNKPLIGVNHMLGHICVDEFQNFATKSFATILSEARKYKLSLILANQYTSQLDEDIKNAIFGNVGSIVSFTLGYDDAAIMTSQFKEMVGVNDLISLPKYTTYTRLMIDGISSDPFSTKTLPPFSPTDVDNIEEHIEKIRRQSRQRYAMERNQLESLLNAWGKKTFSAQEKVAEKARLEAMGLDQEDSKVLQDFVVEQSIGEFDNFTLGAEKADAMVMDKDNKTFKYVWYKKPENLEEYAKIQYAKGKTLTFPTGKKIQLGVDSYVATKDKKKTFIWIGNKDEIKKLIQDMKIASGLSETAESPLIFIPNVEKLQKSLQKKGELNKKSDGKGKGKPQNFQPEFSGEFSVNDIKLGEKYEGYVKLMYNYGMFVTVKGVEGLLHKNWIAPLGDGVEWKKYYNIGDKITVTAKEFKDIDGEKRVVWSQK